MPDTDNGKVTLALLNNNILHISRRLDELCAEMVQARADHESRIRELEAWQRTTQERWRQHEVEHQDMAVKNRIAEAVTAGVAALVGIFVKVP